MEIRYELKYCTNNKTYSTHKGRYVIAKAIACMPTFLLYMNILKKLK